MPLRISKIDFTRYCPACGARHTKADIDGGRCLHVDEETDAPCLHMLCAVNDEDLHQYVVESARNHYIVRAETRIQVERVLERLGYKIQSVVEIIEGSIPKEWSWKYDTILHDANLVGKTIEAIGQGVVPGSSGNESCTWLYFSDGTKHGFVWPSYEQDELEASHAR